MSPTHTHTCIMVHIHTIYKQTLTMFTSYSSKRNKQTEAIYFDTCRFLFRFFTSVALISSDRIDLPLSSIFRIFWFGNRIVVFADSSITVSMNLLILSALECLQSEIDLSVENRMLIDSLVFILKWVQNN